MNDSYKTIKTLKQKKTDTHQKHIMNINQIARLEATQILNKEIIEANENVLNTHAKHIKEQNEKLESLHVYGDILGNHKRFNSNNLKGELESVHKNLSDKVECGICMEEFYPNDVLNCGNNHYICIKRSDETPGCLEAAISSAAIDAAALGKKPYVLCVYSRGEDKKTKLNINSVFSKIHPEGQNIYLNSLLKFETDKLKLSLQEKF